jgi:quaternary ammonium compound-resistance protein SugE
MMWVILVVSGMLEAVWATALGASQGFKKLWPSVVFVVAMTVSMVLLAVAMTELPTGTAYAVWVGIGASLTALWSMVSGAERASVMRVALIVVLIGCVVGLKVVS